LAYGGWSSFVDGTQVLSEGIGGILLADRQVSSKSKLLTQIGSFTYKAGSIALIHPNRTSCLEYVAKPRVRHEQDPVRIGDNDVVPRDCRNADSGGRQRIGGRLTQLHCFAREAPIAEESKVKRA
jgi:hypothetical protein